MKWTHKICLGLYREVNHPRPRCRICGAYFDTFGPLIEALRWGWTRCREYVAPELLSGFVLGLILGAQIGVSMAAVREIQSLREDLLRVLARS